MGVRLNYSMLLFLILSFPVCFIHIKGFFPRDCINNTYFPISMSPSWIHQRIFQIPSCGHMVFQCQSRISSVCDSIKHVSRWKKRVWRKKSNKNHTTKINTPVKYYNYSTYIIHITDQSLWNLFFWSQNARDTDLQGTWQVRHAHLIAMVTANLGSSSWQNIYHICKLRFTRHYAMSAPV